MARIPCRFKGLLLCVAILEPIGFAVAASAQFLQPPPIYSPGSGAAPGSSISTSTPTFQWGSVSGASGYGLYVSQYPYGSGNIIFSTTGLTGTSYTIPAGYLNNGGQYRWNMTTFNSAGEGAPGSQLYFTVNTVSTLPPPPIYSPGSGAAPGSSISTSTPTFQWGSVSGASGYGLYVSQYPYGSGNIVFSTTGLSGTSYTIPAGYLSNGGQYRWNMTTFNSAGEGAPGSQLYFTVNTVSTLPPPPIYSPGSGAAPGSSISTSTPIFQWGSVSGASGYGLYVSQYPYGSGNIVFSTTGLSGTSYTIPAGYLSNGGQYRWNMTTFNSAGEGAPGSQLYFTVNTVSTLPPPPIYSPGSGAAPGSSISTTTPTFQWGSVSGASGYGLYVSQYPYGSGNIVFSTTGLTGTSYTIPAGYLNNGGQYRWNMTTFNSAGEGAPGSQLYFTVNTVSTLPAPPIYSPGSGAAPGPSISTTAPTFQWGSVSGASGYGLYVSQYPYGSGNIIFSTTGLSGTSYTIPAGYLNNGGQYRWNMTTFNSAGEGAPGSQLYFTVNTVSALPAPPIYSPGSGAAPGPSISTTAPTFQWGSVSGASGYGLYVSQYPYGLGNIVFSTTGLTGTSYTIPAGYLNNGGQYRWNMTTFNSAGEGAPGSQLYFTVNTVSTLPAPPIYSPGLGAAPGPSISTTAPTFQWGSVSGASGYGLYVSQYPYGSGNIVFSTTGLSGTSYTIPAGYLNNGGQYRWNMTTFDGAGEGVPGSDLYFTVNTGGGGTLPPPTIVSPGLGTAPGPSISTTTPAFQWEPVGGASGFGLYVSQYPYGSDNIVFSTTGLTGTSYTIPGGYLNDGGQYRWNMTTLDGAGEGAPGSDLYFTVNAGGGETLSPPTIVSPGLGTAPGPSISTTTPAFQWEPVGGASGYGLYVSQYPYGSDNIVFSATGLTGTSYTIPAGYLTNGGEYRWNMTTFDNAGEGMASSDLYFTVGTTSTPSPPTIVSPGSANAPGPSVSTTVPTLTWNPVAGATTYTVFVRIAPYGSSNVVYQKAGLNGMSYPIPGGYLFNNHQYQWNMTASNGAGQSAPSNSLYFSVRSLPNAGSIGITLVPSPSNGQYVITSTPSMPTIRARAQVLGIEPDPTPGTIFTWTASLRVHENASGSKTHPVPAHDVDFGDSDIVQKVTTTGSGLYTLTLKDPSMFRGGMLQLAATASVNGVQISGTTDPGLEVVGTNPDRSTIEAIIDQGSYAVGNGLSASDVSDALKRIACQESTQEEFFGTGLPIISSDNGVGLFQITSCPCDPFQACRNVMFDWINNVQEGTMCLSQKAGPANGYPAALRFDPQYISYIKYTINPKRLAAGRRPIDTSKGAPAPGFTATGLLEYPLVEHPPNQLLEDAVRGYNGFSGHYLDTHLHEFVPDAMFLQNASIPQLATPLVWKRVPAAMRPTGGAYVADVAAHDPGCNH